MSIHREAPPGQVLDLHEMTRAAIAEVGARVKVEVGANGGIRTRSATQADRAMALRASWLARMAAAGPDAAVRCAICAPRQPVPPECITAREALMGRTCGGT